MILIKSKLSLILIFSGFLFLLYSCGENRYDNTEEVSYLSIVNYSGFLFPEESDFNITQEFVEFTLPPEYKLVGIDSNNDVWALRDGKITCDCDKGSGSCSPTETNSTVGCNTKKDDPCDLCTMKVESLGNEVVTFQEYYIQTPADESTNFSVLSEIRPVLEFDEWTNSSWLNTDDANNLDEILDLVNNLWENNLNIPSVIVPMLSPEGKYLMEIPSTKIEGGIFYTSVSSIDGNGDNGTVSSSCSGCDGKCKLKKAAFGKVRYCDGCNSGCTLSW